MGNYTIDLSINSFWASSTMFLDIGYGKAHVLKIASIIYFKDSKERSPSIKQTPITSMVRLSNLPQHLWKKEVMEKITNSLATMRI